MAFMYAKNIIQNLPTFSTKIVGSARGSEFWLCKFFEIGYFGSEESEWNARRLGAETSSAIDIMFPIESEWNARRLGAETLPALLTASETKSEWNARRLGAETVSPSAPFCPESSEWNARRLGAETQILINPGGIPIGHMLYTQLKQY